MKRCGFIKALALTVSLIFVSISCEIGLGSSVDVAAPTISITYPEQSSVIRDTFVLAGDCADDMGVAKITVTISRTDTGTTYVVKQFDITGDNENHRWQTEINAWLGEGNGYNGWELCDGKYIADVYASDDAGRISDTSSLSFDIDNTAPIFILKNPTSENKNSPSSYGTTFKITGTMSDDHTVSAMTVKVYDRDADLTNTINPPVPLETVVEQNIDVTTEVVIANFKKEGELQNRYNHMYVGTELGKDKNLLCTIAVQDNAKEYKNPLEKVNNSIGNITNNFYITDKVSSVWTTGDMDPGRVRKIVNGTATNISDDIAANVLSLYNEKASSLAYFFINSDADPTYEINSYGIKAAAPITKLATTSASLTLNLTYGRNQENILPNTLKVFLWGPYDADEVTTAMFEKMYSTDKDKLIAFYEAQKTENKARVLAYNGEGTWEGKQYKKDGVVNEAGYDEGSKDYYIQSIEIEDTILANKYYYISAYAEDLMGASAKPKNERYAFKGQSSGAAPTVNWDVEETKYGTNSVEDQGIIGSGVLTFYGSVKFPDGIESKDKITYKAERTDITATPIENDVTEIGTDYVENLVYWKVSIPGIAAGTEAVENWKITVDASSTSAEGIYGEAKRTFTIDTQKPVIKLKSLNPSVKDGDNKYLNGKITVEGTLDEKNPDKLWYEIWSDGKKVYSTEETPYGSETRNINEVIDTTDEKYKLIDEKALKIKFYAVDKAGNESVVDESETSILNANKDFILKQSTDTPSITANFSYDENESVTKDKLISGAWYDKAGKLNFSVSDDDGLKSVTIKKNSEPSEEQSITENTTNTSISYAVPQADGIYKITVVATDNTYASARTDEIKAVRQVTWGPYVIGVDTANPKVSDDYSKGTNYYKEDSNHTLKGDASDENGIAEIVVTVTKEGAASPSKIYKLSAENTKVTYKNNKWSVDIKDELEEGNYSVETVVTDYAGKTATASSRWVVDIDPPVVSAEITSTATDIDGVAWYKNKSVVVKATATDSISGVDEVQYSLDNSNWVSLKQDTVDKTKWIGTVICEQGENKIYIKAKDKVNQYSTIKIGEGNAAVTYLTANVDTNAPDVKFVSLNNVEESSMLINGKSDVTLIVNVTDTGIGVDTVKVTKIKDTTLVTPLEGSPDANGNYTIVIPKDNLSAGDVFVTVEDKAANKNTDVKVATLSEDKKEPVITIIDVSPVVKKSGDSCVNGTIKIKAKIDEDNLSKVWYKVYSDGSEVENYSTDQTIDPELNIELEIDTTKSGIKDGKTFDVVIFAEDKAKNTAAKKDEQGNVIEYGKSIKTVNNNALFKVDQSTDKPVFDIKSGVSKWFTAKENFIGSVTDDDVIKSIKVYLGNNSGEEQVASGSTASLVNFSYALPETDGKYTLKIVATDNTYDSGATATIKANRTTTYGPITVGVDTANPNVSEDHATAGTTYTKDDISLSGIARDANGIKEIKIEVLKANGTVAKKADGSDAVYDATSKYDSTTEKWSYKIPDADLEDGEYNIKVTAKDNADKTNFAQSYFVKDKVAPSVTPSVVTSKTETISTKDWYKNTSIEIKAVVNDATSGVSNVQYSTNNGESWTSFKKDAGEWKATVKCEQGENQIKIKATDKADNTNETKSLTVYVDTEAPEVTLLKIDSDTVSAENTGITKLNNGTTPVTFVVKAIDVGTTNTGVASVTLVEAGKETVSINPVSFSNGEYTFEIPAENLKDGAVKVIAKDNLGNASKAKELFSLSIDTKDPEVSVNTVTPVIDKNSEKNVNGKIQITGSANDLNLNKVWYTISVNGTEEKDDENNVITHTLTNGVNIEIDTTKYANNTKLDVIVYAEDKVGRQGHANASDINGKDNGNVIQFTVDQSTDVPEITLSNIATLRAPETTASSIPEAEWFTNSKDNNLIGYVSDDDILKSVDIKTKDSNENVVTEKGDYISADSTASMINFSYALPSDDGVYQVTITAKDNTYYDEDATEEIKANRMYTVGPFVVGVDKTAPSIEENSNTTTKFIKNGDISLSGTASDKNGIKEIKIEVLKADGTVAKKANGSDAVYDAKSKYDSTTEKWSYTIPNADLTSDGKYKITITAKDYAGKTKTIERNFVKDNAAPTVTLTVPTATKTINSNKWYNSSLLTISAIAEDTTSNVKEVSYSFTNNGSDWIPFRQDKVDKTKWTANINCPNQGENKIYVKATDEAELTGKITDSYQSVYVDTEGPNVCTLVSIDENITIPNKKYVDGKSDVKFIVEATDAKTNVSKVELIKVNNALDTPVQATSKGSNKYEITIDKTKLNTGDVVVKVYDELNNTKEYTLFSISKDSQEPTVNINPLSDAEDTSTADNQDTQIDVNGEITFTGSAYDETDLTEVKFYYSVGTSLTDPTTGTELTNNTGTKYSWSVKLNTKALTDKKNLYFYVVAKDAAGNTKIASYSDTDQLYINQDTDRPRISLSNLELTTADADGKYWHTSRTLNGTVVDDDGTVTNVEWSTTGEENSWSSANYSRGSWKIELTDGAKDIYFKVTDAKGRSFVSAASGMKGPKVYDSNGNESCGFAGKVSEIIPLKIDTRAPSIVLPLTGYVSDNATYDSTHALEDIRDFGTVGGSKKRYLYLKVEASDDNGIGSIDVKLDGSAGTEIDSAKIERPTKCIKFVKFDLSTLSKDESKRVEDKEFVIDVTDKVGKPASEKEKITVDNINPIVNFTTRNNSTVYGTIANTVYGRTVDGSEITGLYYMVTAPDSATEATPALNATGWAPVAYSVAAENQIAKDNWSLSFDGSESTTIEFHTDKFCDLYKVLKNKTDAEMTAIEDNLLMSVWVYAEDAVGNKSTPEKLALSVIPNADKPTVTITYPSDNGSVGGTIRVTGTTSIVQDSVEKVYIQIDPNAGDSGFATNWESKLTALMTANGVTDYSIVDTGKPSPYNRGIEAKGTTGWAVKINAKEEFNNSGKIAIRAFAISSTNHRISEATVLRARIDPESPVFGNIEGYEMKVVQYKTGNSGDTSASQVYTDNMPLKGEWFLTGSISDSDSGIWKATVRMPGDTSTTTLIEAGEIKNRASASVSIIGEGIKVKEETYYNYNLNIPIGKAKADGGFGTLKYEVNIWDGSDSHSPNSYTYVVTYDNEDPVFALTTTNTSTIVQSNGTYSLEGTVKEDKNPLTNDEQSGFERVVMYITKSKNSKKYIVDPMISNGTTGYDNREPVGASPDAADGLYWRTATISGVSSGSMTVSEFGTKSITKVTPEVRAGGLCKVDGVIYRIKTASGTTVVLDDASVTTSATSVQFAIGALVIDNPNIEGGINNHTTSVYDDSTGVTDTDGKDTSLISSGDGDQMIEGARTIDTETQWQVSIDSTQILDGEVTIHFVAFDKAGNFTTDDSFTATVNNNAPRLAGVKYGSDLNNNGTIEPSEWTTKYADLYVQKTLSTSSIGEKVNGMEEDGTPITSIEVAAADRQTIKRDLQVIPQVVGGDIGLEWKMTYRDNEGKSKTTGKTAFKNVGHSFGVVRNYGTNAAATDYKSKNDSAYTIALDTLDFLTLNNNVGIDRRTSDNKNLQDLVFTISDTNEDGNHDAVSIKLPVKILFADGEPPIAKITPFYWKSNSENSLYNNSRAYGHIELGTDWTTTTSTETEFAKVTNDTDPKISGIVTIEGEVSDNVVVNQIAVSVDDGTNYTTIAVRNDDGEWTSGTNNANLLVIDSTHKYKDYFTSGNNQPWYFELVSDETINEENVVKFKFHWNTRNLISSVTQADVKFKLKATDKGTIELDKDESGNVKSPAALKYTPASNTPGDTVTTAENKTDYYKMDVVPYIAKVYTELAKLKGSNEDKWTMTSRTARGSYPVRVTIVDQAGTAQTTTSETIAFYGFNLADATYTDYNNLTTPTDAGTQLSNVTGVYDVRTLPAHVIKASETSYSGNLALKVGYIYTINNINNDNAKGAYTGTFDSSTYAEYAYNRQPNDDNNEKLTDNVSFDIWQINEGAARPYDSGKLEQLYMDINPATGKIGLGFIDGSYWFSMAGTTSGNASPTDDNTYSTYTWTSSNDFCTSAGFTFDKLGRSFGVASGGASDTSVADLWSLYSSLWGSAGLGSTDKVSESKANKIRLESLTQDAFDAINKQRIKSSSLATAVHGSTTNLYIAYYDAINDEVRIKYGPMSGTTKANTGDFQDIGGSGTAYGYGAKAEYFTMIAGATKNNYATVTKTDTTGGGFMGIGATTHTYNHKLKKESQTSKPAGQYVSIDVISEEGTNVDDNVVAVWYDGKTLWYSNNSSAYADYTKTKSIEKSDRDESRTNEYEYNQARGTWNAAVPVFDQDSDMAKAGEYCKVVVDYNGGVHIAGYDTKNLDLCYAYLPANKNGRARSSSDFKTCVVDSQGVTGSNLNIDVAIDSAGNLVPQIGYYSGSTLKPKIAYYYGGFANNGTPSAGVDDDFFTGNWEVSLVPTRDTVEMQSNQFNAINIGVWKTDAGVLKNSVIGTRSVANGNCMLFGNGTSNAVVGYVIAKDNTNSLIETAQKR